ncbi:Plasmid recombination enzyme [Lachnospiraceae bacterium XBB2008]|nr:Plasmid recombination enzyme [Lachnospiraceae bacterium XBB2008]
MKVFVSYSIHISNDINAIHDLQCLTRALEHNLRKRSQDQDKDFEIAVIIGPSTVEEAIEYAKTIVREKTEQARLEYNLKQTRKDRQYGPDDLFYRTSESQKTDLAAEIIIQIGDGRIWKDVIKEDWDMMISVYKREIDKLQRLFPEIEIFSASIHLDEDASPHMHALALPFYTGNKNGLSTTICKTKVFTPERLMEMQIKMREGVIDALKSMYPEQFNDAVLIPKGVGRNMDIPKNLLKFLYRYESDYDERVHEIIRINKSLEEEGKEFEKYKEHQIRRIKEDRELIHERELDLDNREDEVNRKKDILENEARNKLKEFLETAKKELENKITQALQAINDFLNRDRSKRIKGRHVAAVQDILNARTIEEDTAKKLSEIGYRNTLGKTEDDVLHKAEAKDIKDIIEEQGIARGEIENSDIRIFKKLVDKGMPIDDAASIVAKNIIKNLEQDQTMSLSLFDD